MVVNQFAVDGSRLMKAYGMCDKNVRLGDCIGPNNSVHMHACRLMSSSA
jgi:hypothetical protein